MSQPITKEHWQLKVMAALTIGVLGLVFLSGATVFQRFFGATNPLLIFAAVGVLGVVLSALLTAQGWLAIYRQEGWKGLPHYFAFALLFGFNAILIDLKIVLPADINVPFPMSLLFYPAIDFFVQVVFHVLPLAVLLLAMRLIFKQAHQEKLIWIAIVAVALLEPIYQMLHTHSLGAYPLWSVALVGLHVYLINFVELLIFKRYDFVARYLFRLVFYAVWHIVWGHFRLGLLFDRIAGDRPRRMWF